MVSKLFPSHDFSTVTWGVSAIIIFALGLTCRLRAYRLIGLAGLAICVPRVFIYDLSDTFYRIVAFGVLALVLLVIGFLYSKFKDLVDLSGDDHWNHE